MRPRYWWADFKRGWERFNAWRKTIAWSRVASYVITIAILVYAINDLYDLVDTPATKEIHREITVSGTVNEQKIKTIVRAEVYRILEQEGLVKEEQNTRVASSSPNAILHSASGGGGSSTGSAPPSQPNPPPTAGGGDGSNGGGGSGGGSTPAPNPPPEQPPVQLPSVPDVVQQVCNDLPPQVDLPVCP
jgi:hypothetical protein